MPSHFMLSYENERQQLPLRGFRSPIFSHLDPEVSSIIHAAVQSIHRVLGVPLVIKPEQRPSLSIIPSFRDHRNLTKAKPLLSRVTLSLGMKTSPILPYFSNKYSMSSALVRQVKLSTFSDTMFEVSGGGPLPYLDILNSQKVISL